MVREKCLELLISIESDCHRIFFNQFCLIGTTSRISYSVMLWVNEGLKKKKVKLLVTQSCQTLCDPMDCSSPGFFIDGIFQGRILGIFPSSEALPNPGKTPRSPALQADSLPSEPPGNVGRQGTIVRAGRQGEAAPIALYRN